MKSDLTILTQLHPHTKSTNDYAKIINFYQKTCIASMHVRWYSYLNVVVKHFHEYIVLFQL